jgi:CHAT domain-containing protein
LRPDSGELVILPHGSLALVPFAALPLGKRESDRLGARYAIRYAPSLASLRAAEARSSLRKGTAAQHALVVGSSHRPTVQTPTGARHALPRLRRAEREAAWVAAKLGATPVTGRAAAEDSVGGRISDALVVHLATRCLAYSAEEKARESFVALVPSAEEDGLLTVGEVIDATPALSAELIVLSGCQTVAAEPKRALGSAGLQQAFLARGVRSILVSLWSASDPAMELLLRRFYTHWLEDADRPSKAEALRRAQTDVRDTAGFRQPRYWAAFKLVGAR